MLVYPYFKLGYFGWFIYGVWFELEYPPERAWMQKYLKGKGFLCFCLWLLHLMWYKSIVEIGLKVAKTGKQEDKINKVEQSESTSPASGKKDQ